MKYIIKLTVILIFTSAIKLSGQGIIIDHNCTELEQIPLSVITDIQENIKWHYAHISHGQQLINGMDIIEGNNSFYGISWEEFLPNIPGDLCVYNGNCGYPTEAAPTYWSPTTCTFSTLDEDPSLNVSQFEWCDDLDTYSESQVDEYLNALNAFGQQYPNVLFVYTTGPAQNGGADGFNRHLRNEQIRAYCAANNKVLFDFADLDSWYDGTQSSYTCEGQQIPIVNPAYLEGSLHNHINVLGATIKGKAAWWMLARIRGWQPGSSSLNIRVFLQGSLSGSSMATSLNSKGLLPLTQPYNFFPINYNGNESVASIPNPNIVDWILLEYRDAATAGSATSNTAIGREVAFLLNNGNVVGLDGNSSLPFEYTLSQNLFIVVWHRNHLGIMSSMPVTSANNVYQYDFSTGSDKVYNSATCYKELIPGIWGMIGGDWNTGGYVNLLDKAKWKVVSGIPGYNNSDYNLNGSVDNQDKNDIWIGNYGKFISIP